jgi:hypothetical protein
MPEDLAPQSVTPPAPGEAGAPPLEDKLVAEAATAAANIVDAALATPQGQAAQDAAEIAAGAEAVGLTSTMPTPETAVEDASSSLTQSNRAAARVVPSDAPQATAWPAPAQSEALAFGNQTAPTPEAAAAAATASHAQAEQVAQVAADLSWKNNEFGVPTPFSRAAFKSVGEAVVNGTDSGESPRVIAENKIADARNLVATSQAEGGEAVQAPTVEAPIQNAVLDEALNEAYGDPATHTVENAAVLPPKPAPGPTQTEVFDAQMARHSAGETWPQIQTPAAGAAGPAETSPQPMTTETVPPAPDMSPATTTVASMNEGMTTQTTIVPSTGQENVQGRGPGR